LLITGFRLDPKLAAIVFPDENLPSDFQKKILQRVKLPEEISFLFSMVDSATGRELQDEPTHNIASLGKSDGARPFRPLAQPLAFQPRSTIRLQIVERSEGIRGTLFIVLYGYKMLAQGCSEPLVRMLRGSPVCPTETIGGPSARIVPFDYVARLELSGTPKNIVQTEVPINVEGGFVATALGYGLAVEERDVVIQDAPVNGTLVGAVTDQGFPGFATAEFVLRHTTTKARIRLTLDASGNFGTPAVPLPVPPGEYDFLVNDQSSRSTIRVISGITTRASAIVEPSGATEVTSAKIDLSELQLKHFGLSALTAGLRIRPNFVRIAFQDNARLSADLPANLVDRIFEPLNQPYDVAFRYSIFDSGTGRDLQNQPINNIAGLGIANGDRPFKRFARPMIFYPRSTIRVTVQEHFGRGTLFLVFQGYKVLGASLQGVRP
jgi:hypothetical protein